MAEATWDRRLWSLFFVLSGSMFLDALEVSVIIVALPSIGAAFHFSPSGAQWVMSGFALGFGVVLPFSSAVVDFLGRRRVYLAALLVFAAASLLAGLASDGVMLVAARLVKGVCAALTAPTGLSIISTTFPEGPSRNRAVSVYTFFGAAGFSAGLLASGALTALGWRWPLLAPAPAALILFMAGLRVIPRHASGAADQSQPSSAGPVMLIVRALARPRLIRAAFCAAMVNGSYWGYLFIVTFWLQTRLKWLPFQVALALLPAGLLLMLSTSFTARMVSRFGAARLIAVGAAAPPAGYALLLWTGWSPAYLTAILPTVLLVGAGFVLCFSALHLQATAGIPTAERASAIGLYQSAVQIGGASLLALTAFLLSGRGDRVLHGAIAASYRPAILLITAASALGLIVALAEVLFLDPEH